MTSFVRPKYWATTLAGAIGESQGNKMILYSETLGSITALPMLNSSIFINASNSSLGDVSSTRRMLHGVTEVFKKVCKVLPYLGLIVPNIDKTYQARQRNFINATHAFVVHGEVDALVLVIANAQENDELQVLAFTIVNGGLEMHSLTLSFRDALNGDTQPKLHYYYKPHFGLSRDDTYVALLFHLYNELVERPNGQISDEDMMDAGDDRISSRLYVAGMHAAPLAICYENAAVREAYADVLTTIGNRLFHITFFIPVGDSGTTPVRLRDRMRNTLLEDSRAYANQIDAPYQDFYLWMQVVFDLFWSEYILNELRNRVQRAEDRRQRNYDLQDQPAQPLDMLSSDDDNDYDDK